MMIFEAVRSARDGTITVRVGVKDGRVYVDIPGAPERLFFDDQVVAIDFQAFPLVGANVTVRYACRRESA